MDTMNMNQMQSQLQTYFESHPEQYKQFLKVQNSLKEHQLQEQLKSLTPKERMNLKKKEFHDKRMTSQSSSFLEKKTKQKDEDKESEKKIKDDEIKKQIELKKEKKREKKRLYKLRKQSQNEEIIYLSD